MTEQQDTYQSITVAQARAAVQASGLLEGIEGPEFAAGQPAPLAEFWRPFFIPTDGTPHPDLARVIVTRAGQKPREVIISWAEYADQMESDAEWDAIREKKPMAVFGGEAERHAYRVVFADVLSALEVPRDRNPAQSYSGDAWEPAGEPARDWLAELALTESIERVDALFAEARDAKALTNPELHEAFGRRLRELVAVKATPATAPSPAPRVVPSPAAVAAKSKPLTVDAPRRPQGQRPRRRRSRSESSE